MVEEETRAAAIAAFNDALRCRGAGGQVVLTRGIAALNAALMFAVLQAVRSFAAFTPDNDPHGEHDCAVVEVEGMQVIWKVDYYDRAMTNLSRDPTDPAVTVRILTVMLAEEY
ncbi:MAG: DUF3768 domain-containing protein [Reyranella sp.]|nr:DUF3768 domain-containing protein [Reyranella sp.]MBL6851925.1 DUF3768 domain-containing protein [Alphaproteobacteria bacterium]